MKQSKKELQSIIKQLKAANQQLQSNLQELKKKKNFLKKIQTGFNHFQTVIDAIDSEVYVADMNTYELIYSNKKFNDLFGEHIGEKCFSVIQKEQNKPCEFCTNNLLVDNKGNLKNLYKWEYRNPQTNRWYQCRDQAIKWVDGRIVRLEIATDITESKKAEAELLELKKELEEKVKEQTQKLNEKVDHLQRFHDATVQRELRIKELQDEIEALKEKYEDE